MFIFVKENIINIYNWKICTLDSFIIISIYIMCILITMVVSFDFNNINKEVFINWSFINIEIADFKFYNIDD